MKLLTFLTVAFLFAIAWSAQADQVDHSISGNTTPLEAVSTLEAQAKAMSTAVQARDVHALHEIDHAVPDETTALQRALPSLSIDQKQKLDALCADLAKQASRAHHDGHHDNWDDDTDAQKQFDADTRQIGTLLGFTKS